MKKACIVTLTTDFGLQDPFVGIMKGVIYSISPGATLVDLSHEIERHHVEEALYTVQYAYPYFPQGTIHLIVVDPGVGTGRRPLLAESEGSYFMAPDNGVLSFLFDRKPACTVRAITSQKHMRSEVSHTFHGRDIFAPAAAWLSRGVKPEQLGSVVTDYTRLNIPQLLMSEHGIRGEVIHVDRFGNLITNVQQIHLEPLLETGRALIAEIKGTQIRGLYSAYAENRSDRAGMIINSFNLLEIFCYKESAAEKTGLRRGDRLHLLSAPWS